MLIITVCGIIGLVLGAVFGYKSLGSIVDGVVAGLFLGVIGVVLGVFLSYVALFAFTATGKAVVNLSHTDTPLVALQDNPTLKGEFHGFLGVSGSIDGSMMYNYYTKSDGYALETVDAKKAKVYDDSDKPFIRVYKVERFQNDVANIVIGTTFMPEWPFDTMRQYELHVPPNSVSPTITLDAK